MQKQLSLCHKLRKCGPFKNGGFEKHKNREEKLKILDSL